MLESPSDWDIVLLVETWARTDGVKLTNGNYDILQNLVTSDVDDSDDPTLNRRGKGVAIVFKKHLVVTKVEDEFNSEFMLVCRLQMEETFSVFIISL